ncbi:DUF362 domain-containing protein [Candidatus Woesearchaeota archaeon]|nr:DUF362 domain-containing protein [Candidatus Woesearchaeota archaeon]
MPKVFLTRSSAELIDKVRDGLEWVDWKTIVQPHARVFVKPNFTWNKRIPGATTTPALLESLLAILTSRTSNVIVGESDGGMHAFTAEESFAVHNMPDICRQYGAKLVNLSRLERESVTTTVGGKPHTFNLPRLLLHETDVFITVPLLKVHMWTGVSLGFKNQWGCIPDTMRLLEHYRLHEGIVALNKILRPRVSIIDGLTALDGNGPIFGTPVTFNTLIISNDLGAGDLIGCKVMGIDPMRIRHLALAQSEGILPRISDVELNEPVERFATHRFRPVRTGLNRVSILIAKSARALRFVYASRATPYLYRVVNQFRRRNL